MILKLNLSELLELVYSFMVLVGDIMQEVPGLID
jgi:hypothetical protein